MIKTFNLTADVPQDREVRIQLPDDVPTGPADIVIVVAPHTGNGKHTLGDLLHSELFGLWRGRTDIEDSAEFARRLRADGWSQESRLQPEA